MFTLHCVSCPCLFVQATGESVDEEPEDSSPVSPEQLKDHYHKKLHHLQEKLKVSVCRTLSQSLIYVIVFISCPFCSQLEHLGEIALLRLQHADEMRKEREKCQRLLEQNAGRSKEREGVA